MSIASKRNEFIENLSSLVENDIINKEKLLEIFESPEFKFKFEKLTCDFYENCLYETVGNGKFSDIDGFDSSLKGLDNFVIEILNNNLESLIGLIADNFDAEYFLTNSQSEKIADSIYNSIKDVI